MSITPRAHRVPVTDPVTTDYDYADAYAVDLPGPDPATPETWLRAGLAAVPPFVDRVVARLGFPTGTGDPLNAFTVRTTDPGMTHLEVALPMMRVHLVGRNPTPTRRTFTTLVTYTRPWLGRLVMAVIGPAHRLTARRLVTTGVSSTVDA